MPFPALALTLADKLASYLLELFPDDAALICAAIPVLEVAVSLSALGPEVRAPQPGKLQTWPALSASRNFVLLENLSLMLV